MPEEQITTTIVAVTEQPTAPTPEAPKPAVRLTTVCDAGPAKEHEWTTSEEINILRCSHCGQRGDAALVIFLYQSTRISGKKRMEELETRLAYELKRGSVREMGKGEFKTDAERQLFEDNDYFKVRLQEEMDVNNNMKKEVSAASRKVTDMIQDVKNFEASNASLRKDRDYWKAAYKELKVDLQKLTSRVMEEGP